LNALRRFVAALVFSSAALVTVAAAPEPRPVLPQSLTWVRPPDTEGLKTSWIVGGEKLPGAYLVRVTLAADAKIAPHSHPDQRITTVLAGTIYVGFGTVFDADKVVGIPVGGVYVTPANQPHYVWAKDGEAQYQESGSGPTGSLPPN
jgi:quercetin dioxygenase-like cupin family protein